MKIQSIGLSLPSWKLTNQDIIDQIRFYSKNTFSGNLEQTLRKIAAILKKTGAENRYWLDKSKNERPIDHIKNAVEISLNNANISKNDIDLLIYVGIGKGFLEPGNSYSVAHSLGMNRVRCFDLTDACMSWSAALQVVDSLFKAGAYKNAMIVNGEFTVTAGPLIDNYSLKNNDQLVYTFPTFTVGEAATCTILTPDDSANFSFSFSSRADLSDLCVIPLPGYEKYCDLTEKMASNGPMHFTSYGVNLHQTAAIEATELFRNLPDSKKELDIVFTHASSKAEWHKYGQAIGIEDKIYHIYQKTGNLVSASVPAAMVLAKEEGKLKSNDKVLVWVGSAGMSFSAINFSF